MFFDHNEIKLEINKKDVWKIPPKYLEIKQYTYKSKGGGHKGNKHFKVSKTENAIYQNLWDTAKALREIYSIKFFY